MSPAKETAGMSEKSTGPQHQHQRSKSWYQYLTLDLFILVLSKSVFHPAITLIFYLCLASVHQHKTPLAYYTLYWAAFLSTIEILLYINYRVTYGWPRKVNWKDEVVVITGGGSGLGRVLAEMLMISRGVRVAVLDVKEPDQEALEWIEGRGDFLWAVCDVSDLQSVQRAAERVKTELGTPTVLINNAAAPVNGLPLIPSTTSEQKTLQPVQAAKTFSINTISHFNTLSAFLPSLISNSQGAHIITISSILSHLAPTSLPDYAASKAAVSALHHSLANEIASHPNADVRKKVKTILVEPGQLDTTLFSGVTEVPWYANFFGAVVEAKDLAREIVRQLERGEAAILRAPYYATCMAWYGAMPGIVQRSIRWFSGIDHAIVINKNR